jgi:hypothetical protein
VLTKVAAQVKRTAKRLLKKKNKEEYAKGLEKGLARKREEIEKAQKDLRDYINQNIKKIPKKPELAGSPNIVELPEFESPKYEQFEYEGEGIKTKVSKKLIKQLLGDGLKIKKVAKPNDARRIRGQKIKELMKKEGLTMVEASKKLKMMK